MSLLKKIVLGAMVLTLLFSGLSTTNFEVNAQTIDKTSDEESMALKFEQMNEVASKSIEVKDSKKIQLLTDMSKNAISSKQVILNHSNAELVFDDARFLEIKENKENYTSVTIPIVGDQYSLISNFTLVFDSENKLLSYSETLITKSKNDKFIISTFFDGTLAQNQETDIDYISNSELQKELETLQNVSQPQNSIQGKSFNEIALCISVIALVDLTVARIIAATCIASCPAIPPICVACIGTVGVIGAANIPAVVACFK